MKNKKITNSRKNEKVYEFSDNTNFFFQKLAPIYWFIGKVDAFLHRKI